MLRKGELWTDIITCSLQTNRGALGYLLAEWQRDTPNCSNNLSRRIDLFLCKEINPDGQSSPLVCCHSASVVLMCWYPAGYKAQ